MFQDSGFNSEDERSGPIFGQRKPAARTSLLNHREEDEEQGMTFGTLGREERLEQKLSSAPRSTARQPKAPAFQPQTNKPQAKPVKTNKNSNMDRTQKVQPSDDPSARSLLALGPDEYAKMMEYAKKNKTYSQYQIQNADPETSGPGNEIGFEKPKTAVGRIYQGVFNALSRTGKALQSEEMKKGVEFGFRAAREVQKYVHDKTFKNAVKNIALGKALPDNAVAANSAVTLAMLSDEGLYAYLGKYKEIGEDLADRIKAIKKEVWEDSEP